MRTLIAIALAGSLGCLPDGGHGGSFPSDNSEANGSSNAFPNSGGTTNDGNASTNGGTQDPIECGTTCSTEVCSVINRLCDVYRDQPCFDAASTPTCETDLGAASCENPDFLGWATNPGVEECLQFIEGYEFAPESEQCTLSGPGSEVCDFRNEPPPTNNRVDRVMLNIVATNSVCAPMGFDLSFGSQQGPGAVFYSDRFEGRSDLVRGPCESVGTGPHIQRTSVEISTSNAPYAICIKPTDVSACRPEFQNYPANCAVLPIFFDEGDYCVLVSI